MTCWMPRLAQVEIRVPHRRALRRHSISPAVARSMLTARRPALPLEGKALKMPAQIQNVKAIDLLSLIAAALANVQSEMRSFARVVPRCTHRASTQTGRPARACRRLKNRWIRGCQTRVYSSLIRCNWTAMHHRSQRTSVSARSRRAARAWQCHRRCARRSRTPWCARRRVTSRRREALYAQTFGRVCVMIWDICNGRLGGSLSETDMPI